MYQRDSTLYSFHRKFLPLFDIQVCNSQISDDYQSDRKGENGQTRPSLRKTLSLPSEALRRKVEPPAKPSTPEEIIANLESKLEEMKRTKEVLEDERVSLLDTLCKQDKQVKLMSECLKSEYCMGEWLFNFISD